MTFAERNSSDARSAADPWLDGRPPHIPTDRDRLPTVCLLPGDPARVGLAGELLDDFRIVGVRREYTLGIGTFDGQEVAVCSTGIGGPSTEIAVVELHRLGVRAFLRVGGMGATAPNLAPGSITLVARALRDGGTSRFYADDDPLPASPTVVDALRAASARVDVPLHDITVLSCDSYYIGEGRPLPGLEARAKQRLDEVEALGADAMDMECETVFAVSRALGGVHGALLAAHGNRATDAWLEDFEPAQRSTLRVALTAAASLGRDLAVD